MLNIASNTFKEIIRNKFLYIIVFFAFIFIVFSLILGTLTIGESEKVIVDFGIAMIEIFGIIGVLFIGSQLLFKEIEGKTIFLLLSKPIKRRDLIIGKYIGFLGVIALIFLLQSCVYLLVLFYQSITILPIILFSLLFTFLKLAILLALVFFFSSFISPMLTILISITIYIISHSFSLMILMFEKIGGFALYSAQALQVLFPPLEAMNIKDMIGSLYEIEMTYYVFNFLYAFIYIFLLIYITTLIFSRKNFEE